MRRFNLLAPDLVRSPDVGQALGAEQIAARVYELGEGRRSHPFHFHHGIEEWLLVVAGSPLVRMPAASACCAGATSSAFRPGPAVGMR